MIKLKQQIHNLVGDKKAIEELAEKESARILVMSDSHGYSGVFLNIMKDYGKSCDAFVFCGDGTGEVAKVLGYSKSYKKEWEFLPPVFAFVEGNCDPYKTYCDFKPYELVTPQRQILTAAGKSIFISHGHIQGVDYDDNLFIEEAKMSDCQIILHGHTHIAREKTTEEGIKIINPGSPSRPRGGSPAGFAIVTIQKNIVDTAFIKVTKDGYEFYTPFI